jgi:hypothetical protein
VYALPREQHAILTRGHLLKLVLQLVELDLVHTRTNSADIIWGKIQDVLDAFVIVARRNEEVTILGNLSRKPSNHRMKS